MKVALVALQASPLGPSADGGPDDADTDRQAERVSSLARALTELDHRVTVYARREAAALPSKVGTGSGRHR